MDLVSLIAALRDPRAYPGAPGEVVFLQTHISCVFLAGPHAYKIKKPVNLGFLDYSTLERRRHFCQREVELNRRLAPEVYLGVVPITEQGGQVTVEGSGDVVEYAVKMRRLPEDGMMDRMTREDRLTKEMLTAVAVRVAEFHARAETGEEIARYGTPDAIRRNLEENFSQTESFIDIAIAQARYEEIRRYSLGVLDARAELFGGRVRGGRIRDCHGDLHLRNICVDEGEIRIYDCIEFNKRFRYTDVAGDVAFLAMDLDFHRRPDFSDHFVEAYVAASGDREICSLVGFYKCYRAFVRAKVNCFPLDDEAMPTEERGTFLTLARKYFDLAWVYVRGRPRPILLLMAGLMGSGKSVLANRLSQELELFMITSDVVRKRLAGRPLTAHQAEGFGEGIYTEAFSDRTYQAMLDEAGGILAHGGAVILDASFRRRRDRLRARAVADAAGAEFYAIEVTCPEEEIRRRLDARAKESGGVSEGRWELFAEQRRLFDPLTELSPAQHIVVDTSLPLEEVVRLVLGRIGRRADLLTAS